jgi:ectoine hydroxylase-related dioxygenase (phytanoyl-CoA dioxygenase family)
MTYLSDVSPHGGGTVVWPGSHQRIEALARRDPQRYEMMWALGQALGEIDLGPPIELAPRRGDVLFYHHLCAHAGSANTSPRPRFALNMKW